MTEVQFHFNAADPLAYACRLLRKAFRAGARVAVLAPFDVLQRLDRQLWSFDPLDFVPHVLLQPGQVLPTRMSHTPLWLVSDPAQAAQPMLVNLGLDAVQDLQRFERLIEIVSSNADDRVAGRKRWKSYAAQGCPIQTHEVPP